MDTNMIQINFDILKDYEKAIRETLTKDGVPSEFIDSIVKNFDYKREVIFSLNKEYLKGSKFEVFCSMNNLSMDIPKILEFNGNLYKHQENAIKEILNEKNTIISTGTGSGKTESFLIPILDYCLKSKRKGLKAVIIYPMNALATDQVRRFAKALNGTNITFGLYNGETPKTTNEFKGERFNNQLVSREEIISEEPDILITNYVMLERLITNELTQKLFANSNVFKYVVLDEIHSYSGNKGLHIKYLLHRLRYIVKNRLIQIGCSATLSRTSDNNKTDGYIEGDVKTFIETIFNLKKDEEYSYIEPVYQNLSDKDYSSTDKEYIKFRDNEITSKLREAMFKESKSFTEIREIFKENKCFISDEDIILYLSNILKLNSKGESEPLIDFRMHIFLLEVEGVLQRCIKCNTYFAKGKLASNKCTNCGQMILPVYQKNPELLLADIHEGNIIYPKESYRNPILLDFNKDSKILSEYDDFITFKSFKTSDNNIEISAESDSKYKCYYLNSSISNLLVENLEINLSDSDRRDIPSKILSLPLLSLGDDNKKILAFLDNREKTGRNATVFEDIFISRFYEEITKYILEMGRNKSIDVLLNEVVNHLNQYFKVNNSLDENIRVALIAEYPIWLNRQLNFQKEKIYTEISLNNDEKKILDIMIDEGCYGAYFKNSFKEKEIKYIKLNSDVFKYPKYIGFMSSGNSNSVISLGDRGTKYKAFINEYGEEKIKSIIVSLKNKGIVKVDINDKKEIFYLDVKKMHVKLEKSNYTTINEIVNKYLLFTGSHSSEVDKKSREEYEEKFQSGRVNLLFSTSTLEMGIDIGNLSYVYMLGVPPMPSNYSQRAGRAGRQGNRFASIVTLCSNKSMHDMHYFTNPKEMIEGKINPPNFDVGNINVLNKHINTLTYNKVGDKLIKNITIDNNMKIALKRELEKVFDINIDIDFHLNLLKGLLIDTKDTLRINDLYSNGIYPDYNFSRDEVKMIDSNKYEKEKDINKSQISTRDYMQGYNDIFPGSYMFIGNKHYLIEDRKDTEVFETIKNEVINDYSLVYCTPSDKVNKERKRNNDKNEILVYNNENSQNTYKKGPIRAFLNDDLKVQFIKKYAFNDINYNIGFQMIRDSIIFEFDSNVLGDEQIISLISAIDRTLKDELGLDDSEINWLISSELQLVNGNSGSIAVLYEKSGCKTINMNSILNRFKSEKSLFELALSKLEKCSCKKISGCYICLKSYSTQYFTEYLNKNTAKEMLIYLSNNGKYRPQIKDYYEEIPSGNVIKITRKGDYAEFIINDEIYKVSIGKEITKPILNKLIGILKERYLNGDLEKFNVITNLSNIKSILTFDNKNSVAPIEENKLAFYRLALNLEVSRN